jgi:hypothetical protein
MKSTVDSVPTTKKYVLSKKISDEEIEKRIGTFATKKDYTFVIRENADVYNEEGELLMRFRKNVLPQKHVDDAFENLRPIIFSKTSTRGTCSGAEYKKKTPGTNARIMSNIIGYYDKWSIFQKHIMKKTGEKPPSEVKPTSFMMNHPEKWEHIHPLIKNIDRQYKCLVPKCYREQYQEANKTAFRIKDTAFTTVTTNVNFQTAIHRDAGDFKKGFGNLVVIEKGGKYTGGLTVFPQYKVAVDVRTGDFLAMNVHQPHGNTPIVPSRSQKEPSIRLSLVSYLREDVIHKSAGSKVEDVEAVITKWKDIVYRYNKIMDTKKSQTQA